MKEWLPLRGQYLQELVRLEGRGYSDRNSCPSCHQHPAEFRCSDCFGMALLCERCCLQTHKCQPLHIIKVSFVIMPCLVPNMLQRWNGRCFERVGLHMLGLCVQLGHYNGEACTNPHRSHKDFTVIHTNGFHHVRVNFCECQSFAGSWHQQLL